MKIKLWRAALVLAISLWAVSCQDEGERPEAPAPPPDQVRCQGFVVIDYTAPEEPEGFLQKTVGPLGCNGVCEDGSRCEPQVEEFEDGPGGLERREWCGCPGEEEPEFCHGVRETFVIGGRRIERFNCRPAEGGCPAEGDLCRQVQRKIEPPPEGVEERYIAQCECAAPPPETPEDE